LSSLDWNRQDFHAWAWRLNGEIAGYANTPEACPLVNWRASLGEDIRTDYEIAWSVDGGGVSGELPTWARLFLLRIDQAMTKPFEQGVKGREVIEALARVSP
jgi:hypothetical protein